MELRTPTARRWLTLCALVASLIGLSAPMGSLVAQDIEATARARGVELPASYHRRVAENPGLYRFRRALFRRSGRFDGAVGDRPAFGADARMGIDRPETAPARTASIGEVRLPVVLSLFSDSPDEPHITPDMVRASLFEGPSARGTIRDAYLEISRDALTVEGDVYGWTRSSLTMEEVVGTDRSFGPDARVGEYLLEALEAVDGDVDFAQYDNDGPDGVANSGDDDGFVDVVTFEFLEISASCGGPAIWPHRSSLQGQTGAPFRTDDLGIGGDTIFVQDYITQSASDCAGTGVQDASVITHEFGHALGLPDWYHWIDRDIGPFGRRWVLGCWALMAAGSWGCGPVGETRSPFGPTHMIGFSKNHLGWLDPVDPGEVWNEEIILDPIQTSGDALRIPLDDSGSEYLWIEYRGAIGFDAQLPGAGVLMYKQDDNASIRPDPASDDPYFLQMLERDDDRSLLRMATEGGSRGEIEDAWGVDEGRGALNGESSPRLRLADGSWSRVSVHDVRVEEGRARVVLSTGATPRLIAPSGPIEVERVRTFVIPLRVAGGRGPYLGAGELPDGIVTAGVGDELMIVGSLREEGAHDFALVVEDAEGALSDPLPIQVTAAIAWSVEVGDLLQPFLQSSSEGLTPGESTYLDELGNGNGRYDVGDLRRFLREENPPGR